jgi:hypothetical protein
MAPNVRMFDLFFAFGPRAEYINVIVTVHAPVVPDVEQLF